MARLLLLRGSTFSSLDLLLVCFFVILFISGFPPMHHLSLSIIITNHIGLLPCWMFFCYFLQLYVNDLLLFFPAKIPFPLTQRFRSMLQNGIDLSTVDVSYVSSRSWYFSTSINKNLYLVTSGPKSIFLLF